MKKKMRIALWTPNGSGTHYWGPGMSAFRLYQYADKNEISLSLAHGYTEQKDYELFDNQYFIDRYNRRDRLSVVKFLYKSKKWIRANAHQFDVAHCLTDYHNAFMPALWFERMGVPSVIKVVVAGGGFTESSFVSNLLGLRRYRIRHANEISAYITMSREMTDDLLQAGIDEHRIHEIQDGVNIERFKPADDETKKALRKELGLPDKFTVVFTGGFSRRKNPSLIAEAFRRFKDRDDIQLVLIGPDRDDGEERENVEEIVRENGLSNVIILSFVNEIEKYCRASDLFILPSSQEGLSNSLLEAQACGLPAVVTPISGSEDLVDESKNGTFIEPEPGSVYEAVLEYLENREKLARFSKNTRQHIVQNNSSEVVMKKHLELFESIRNNRC